MNAEDCLLFELERELEQIRDTASLFEVPVPEPRPIVNCRRDMKLAKVQTIICPTLKKLTDFLQHLWDFIEIVRSCIDDWKTTPWKKIDVENMDIECKKFAKEIRSTFLHIF